MFRLASQRTVVQEDLWELPTSDQAEHLSLRWSAAWEDAEKHVRAQTGLTGQLTAPAREKVFTAAAKSFLGPGFFVAAPLLKLVNSTLQFAFPVLLAGIVSYIEGSRPLGLFDPTPAVGFGMCAALGFVMFLKAITENLYFFLAMRAGWQLRAAITTAIFRKSLKLSAASRQQRTLGELVNMMQIDTTKLEMFLTQFHVLWDGLYQIVGYCVMLSMLIGWSTVLGVLVMILSMPGQIKLMINARKVDGRIAAHSDRRVKTVNEAMQAMANVKMYSWEHKFAKQIEHHRSLEVNERESLARIKAFSSAYMMAVPLLVSAASFVAYALTDGDIQASILFAALGAFSQLRFPLMFYPMALATLAQARVSRTRLSSFLATTEAASAAEDDQTTADAAAAQKQKLAIVAGEFWWAEPGLPAKPSSEVSAPKSKTSKQKDNKKVSSESTSTKDERRMSAQGLHRPTLKDISLEVNEGELLAIVGSTGVGKSSLCAAMLGEMVRVKGQLVGRAVGKTVAYAAQSAWILNATVKDNIIFGSPWDEKRYQKVISACQLEQDLSSLPNGDATEIGERGITLSGGQKQRVAVARSAYAQTEMCVLDDVLSALDPEVASRVFEECILGHLAGVTRVLVTNRLDLAQRCDRLVMLESDADGVGYIAAIGTHQELLTQRPEYAKLIEETSVAASMASAPAPAPAGAVDATKSAPGPKAKDPKDIKKAAADDDSKHNGLMQKEERRTGAVTAGVYASYVKYAGGLLPFLALLVMHLVSTVITIGASLFVAFWTADAQPVPVVESALAGDNSTSFATYTVMPFAFYVSGYAIIGFVLAILAFMRSVTAAVFCLHASRKLHDALVARVMRAPLAFFDTTPIGRIVSRFSKDVYAIDNDILEQGDMFLFMIFYLVGTAGVIFYATPWFVAAFVPLFLLYVRLVGFYRNVSREAKRLESIARSPVTAHYSETLGGISTIRAYGAHTRFAATNVQHVDRLNEAFYLGKVADRWLSTRLEMIGAVATAGAAVLAVATVVSRRSAGEVIDPIYIGIAGASIQGAMGITGILNYVMRAFAMLEAAMTCTERVLHYATAIPQEAAEHSAKPPPPEWPSKAGIVFNGLKMRYREDTPLVLKGIDVVIEGGQRVGIVGRTGSGKSSLLLSVLRLVEPMAPTGDGAPPAIAIDGIDISKIGLTELRRTCAIIPQNPACFSGTIRSNVDPFDEYTDEEIWAALERCELRLAVEQMVEGGASDAKAALAAPCAEFGENLSLGQRQLLCLARAVLQKARLLILDEATSAVDYGTDAKIQRMIRTVFAGCTILVIAHRINTVIDSDLILVLGDGLLLEAGAPSKLLENSDSAFRRIVDESGDAE